MTILLYMENNIRLSRILGMLDGRIVYSDNFLQQKTDGNKCRIFGIDYDALFPNFQASFVHFHPAGGWDE
jgi:hypothetical protein